MFSRHARSVLGSNIGSSRDPQDIKNERGPLGPLLFWATANIDSPIDSYFITCFVSLGRVSARAQCSLKDRCGAANVETWIVQFCHRFGQKMTCLSYSIQSLLWSILRPFTHTIFFSLTILLRVASQKIVPKM